MVSYEIDVQFWCGKCGRGICSNATPNKRGGFDIDPCDYCLDQKGSEEYERGAQDEYKRNEEATK